MLIKINKAAHIEEEMDALFFFSQSVLHTLAVRLTKFGTERGVSGAVRGAGNLFNCDRGPFKKCTFIKALKSLRPSFNPPCTPKIDITNKSCQQTGYFHFLT